jgi:uncharacterized protein (DUF1015 family)
VEGLKESIKERRLVARIVPFRGILYNQNKVHDLRDVVTPPYDVISEEERQAYHDRHPYNVIRLILSNPEVYDTAENNQYTRAAAHFHAWLEAGILKQDAEPAFYVTEVGFQSEGADKIRLGFIALVRLENFGKGGILPHEKTFSATKADRLRLMEACKANFSPIFSLFSDADREVSRLLKGAIKGTDPDIDFREVIGYRHRLWRVTDPDTHRAISERLAPKALFIADGHHRYETALKYRDGMVSRRGSFDPEAPYNFVMMYLSSMQDPGLTLRPVHRMLREVSQIAMEGFAEKAGMFFHVEVIDGARGTHQEAASFFLARIRAGAGQGVMGVLLRGHKAFYLLRAKEGIMDHLFNGEIPGPLRRLDVTIATRLLLQKVLGFKDTQLDDEKRILYTSRTPKAFRSIDAGECDVALILNATRLSEVEETSRAGLIMPRKSTYFTPKALSGLVMNKLGDR